MRWLGCYAEGALPDGRIAGCWELLPVTLVRYLADADAHALAAAVEARMMARYRRVVHAWPEAVYWQVGSW